MKLMDVSQLSNLLKVKPNTIYDWVHKKRIPYYKLEGCLRFNEDEILKWLKSKKQNTYSTRDAA